MRLTHPPVSGSRQRAALCDLDVSFAVTARNEKAQSLDVFQSFILSCMCACACVRVSARTYVCVRVFVRARL